MKINEVIQERRPDFYKSGEERMRDIQKYQQSVSGQTGPKLTGPQIAKAAGKYNIGGLDQEEIIQRDLAVGRDKDAEEVKKDFEKRKKDQEKQDREEKEKEKKDQYAKARDKREKARQRQRDKEEEREERSKDRSKKRFDKSQGYRKDAAGRTLRAPRYYKDGKTPKGKTAGADGSIRMGIDRFINDPGRTVANYYNDKIDSIKDYINTRI